MAYKRPESVLVVIYEQETGRVLMLQRRDDPAFWQSVTGSLEAAETPRQAAVREVKEETGIDIMTERLQLTDCQRTVIYTIFPHFRHRYAPEVTHNTEHWFMLRLPAPRAIPLTEHLAYEWLPAEDAAGKTISPSNGDAIEEFVCQSGTGGVHIV